MFNEHRARSGTPVGRAWTLAAAWLALVASQLTLWAGLALGGQGYLLAWLLANWVLRRLIAWYAKG